MNNDQFANPLPSGTRLNGGNYTIVGTIGNGGFGITYRAVQNYLNRTVCIKEFFLTGCTRNPMTRQVYPPVNMVEDYNYYRDTFISEARMLASLSHPNIVEVDNVFLENNTAYMVMTFIDGWTLQEVVNQGGALPFAGAMNYMAQIADAVEYIHERHILHHDIKPSNIMITQQDRAILIDFGSARKLDHDWTIHAQFSPGYAPPERYSKDLKKDKYSDIYSFGATFFFALTGQAPIDAPARSANKHSGIPNTEPRQLNPSIPPYVNRAIVRAMEINPSERQQTIREFMKEITGGGTPPPPPPPDGTGKPPMGTVELVGWITLFVCLLALIAIIVTLTKKDHPSPDYYKDYPQIESVDSSEPAIADSESESIRLTNDTNTTTPSEEEKTKVKQGRPLDPRKYPEKNEDYISPYSKDNGTKGGVTDAVSQQQVDRDKSARKAEEAIKSSNKKAGTTINPNNSDKLKADQPKSPIRTH